MFDKLNIVKLIKSKCLVELPLNLSILEGVNRI